jgi:hypothetical protein
MAGLPSNAISVNQSKQYGDQKALDKLKTGLTSTPMTGVPIPAPTAGRPPTPGGGSAPASPGGGQQPVPMGNIPAEHRVLMSQMAQAAKTAQVLKQKAAAPDAGPWLQYYAAVAVQRYQALALKVKTETPFFSGA